MISEKQLWRRNIETRRLCCLHDLMRDVGRQEEFRREVRLEDYPQHP